MKSTLRKEVRTLLKSIKRKSSSHKRDNGTVLVVGGSEDFVGAPLFSSVSALRTGADIVVLAAPEKTGWAVSSMCPDVIVKKLPGKNLSLKHYSAIKKLADKSDAILIGPGIGTSSSEALVKKLIKEVKIPKVIDADALNFVSLKSIRNSILTPHKKEFENLLKKNNLKKKDLKKALNNNIIILKGKIDEIISKERTVYNKTGNSGMTVGGTGDVLAGINAGLISQGLPLISSAVCSAFITGFMGDSLKKQLGDGLIAGDFLKIIARTIRNI